MKNGASDAEVAEIGREVKNLREIKDDLVADEKLRDEIERMLSGFGAGGAGPVGSFAKAVLDAEFHIKTRPTVVVPAVRAQGLKAPTAPSAELWNETTEAGDRPEGRGPQVHLYQHPDSQRR